MAREYVTSDDIRKMIKALKKTRLRDVTIADMTAKLRRVLIAAQ